MIKLKKVIYLSLFILAFTAGYGFCYAKLHLQTDADLITSEFPINELLKLNQFNIDPCSTDDTQKHTVGSLLSEMITNNLSKKINKLGIFCDPIDSHKEKCGIYISNCLPWKNSECGSRMLVFEKNKNQQINIKSLQCLDIP